jgi:cysteine desulfurase / selenocysteine lyase
MFDINKTRADFPALSQKINKHDLIYFDNGATTQKPQSVINTINNLYSFKNSNIHRGVHYLSGEMTNEYENARNTVKQFVNAAFPHEIIFTSGTTASINTIAYSLCNNFICEDDEIILSTLEHHANIVPWQIQFGGKGVRLKIIPIKDSGELDLSGFESLFSEKTKLVSVSHVSNTLGIINPVDRIIEIAHKHGVPVLIDGAQSVQHMPIDVQKMDCDFYVFSGHKVYGPNGIGVLYGKEKWLEKMPPFMGGGDMIKTVSFEKTEFNRLPFKFEAGTTHYIGAIGLASALNYISEIGIENIMRYENSLLEYATEQINNLGKIQIFGKSEHKSAVVSFLVDTVHHYDTGMILDKLGIAVRTGTHCTQPLMSRLGIDGTVRASFAFYNTKQEIDALICALDRVKTMFSV